jgi:hypothetical protein
MWVLAVCLVLLLFVLQVFVCFKMLLTSGSDPPAQVDGCLMYVFNIQGFITHMVLFRSVSKSVYGSIWQAGTHNTVSLWRASYINSPSFSTSLPNMRLTSSPLYIQAMYTQSMLATRHLSRHLLQCRNQHMWFLVPPECDAPSDGISMLLRAELG